MILYFDGGCKPNPGKMEAAIVSDDGKIKSHMFLGHGTNNEAEWAAFLWAVETATIWADEPVTIMGDSNLVIQQALGVWKVKHEGLKGFLAHFNEIKGQFTNLTLKHVGRNDNPAGHYIEEVHKWKS